MFATGAIFGWPFALALAALAPPSSPSPRAHAIRVIGAVLTVLKRVRVAHRSQPAPASAPEHQLECGVHAGTEHAGPRHAFIATTTAPTCASSRGAPGAHS